MDVVRLHSLSLSSGDALFALVQAEGVTELTQKGFIDWCRNGSGYERKHLYDDKKLNEAVQVIWKTWCYVLYDSMIQLTLSSSSRTTDPPAFLAVIHRCCCFGLSHVAQFVGHLSRNVRAEAFTAI